LAASAPIASAQCVIADDTVASASISEAQKQEIAKCIADTKDKLAGDAATLKRARNSLLNPFRNRGITVSFRLEYAKQLMPVLRPLATSDKEDLAVNAVLIAGELATTDGVALVSAALKDKRVPVRMTAAFGYERTFSALRDTEPALAASQAQTALTDVKASALAEADPHVLDGLAMALDAAARVPETKFPDLRAAAVRAVATTFAARTSDPKADASTYPALVRAGKSIVDALNAGGANPLPQEAFKEGGGLSGDMLALALRRVLAGDMSDAERSELANLVAQAEKVFYFAAQKLGVAAPLQLKLADEIAAGKDAEFKKDVLQIIGDPGALTASPFGFPANRFIKK